MLILYLICYIITILKRRKKYTTSYNLSLWCGMRNSNFELSTILFQWKGAYLEQGDTFNFKTYWLGKILHWTYMFLGGRLYGVFAFLRSWVFWKPDGVCSWEVCALEVWSWERPVVRHKWEQQTHRRLCLDLSGAKEGELLKWNIFMRAHQAVKLYVLVLEVSQTYFLLCPSSLCMILITSCIDNVQGLVGFFLYKILFCFFWNRKMKTTEAYHEILVAGLTSFRETMLVHR